MSARASTRSARWSQRASSASTWGVRRVALRGPRPPPHRRAEGRDHGIRGAGFGPWYECVCLHYGGSPTTIDYNPIRFNDDRIEFVKAPIGAGDFTPFDAAFSISSFEHDGLAGTVIPSIRTGI